MTTLVPLDKKNWIAGLEKGLSIIETFDDANPRLSATQAGQRCGLTRTAARRYLLTLAHLGYVATDGKLFWLTPRVMRLGQSYLESARLPRIVQPFLQRLTAGTQEISYVSVLDGSDIVYVARNGTNRAMNTGYVLGARVQAVTGNLKFDATPDAALLAKWETIPAVVVETPADQLMIEQTMTYKGLYFVLMGKLSPLDGVGPHDLGLKKLFERACDGLVQEVILATNFTAEGEATAYVIAEGLKARGIKPTRLARGVPVGSELEYVDLGTIAHALVDRR